MRNACCPRCLSANVYLGSHSPLQAGESLVHIAARNGSSGMSLMLDLRVCADCGHVDMFVTGRHMHKLAGLKGDRQNWTVMGEAE